MANTMKKEMEISRQEEIRKETLGRYPCSTECGHAFYSGAKWADKTMIEKACEWLENNLTYYISVEPRGFEGYELVIEKDEFLTDFKKAMKK